MYNPTTGQYETQAAEAYSQHQQQDEQQHQQQHQQQQRVPGHVMFDAPISPPGGDSRNGSVPVETPTIGSRLEGHDYEYQQALQAEVDARAAHADEANTRDDAQVDMPNLHAQTPSAGQTYSHNLEASEPTGLAYLKDHEQRAGSASLEPAAPVLPPIATGGSIMDRGRVTRKHAPEEYADNGSTSEWACPSSDPNCPDPPPSGFFSRTFGSPTSPGRPTQEEVQAIDAAKDEVRREREAFGIAAGDEPAADRFYTPSASPGLGARPGGFFPGTGQRTISASAFKRNKDRTPGSPVVANSALEPAFSPTAPLDVRRPGSSLAISENASAADRPVAPVAPGSAEPHHRTSAEHPRRNLSVDDDIDVGLGAPLPPPLYGQSHNDTPISETRPDLR